jgi:hypothetical protein
MLLTDSGDELCGLLSALFQATSYHLPTVSLSVFPVFVYWKFTVRSASCSSSLLWWQGLPPGYFCRLCLLKVPVEISSLLLLISPECLEHPAPLLCVPFQFLVYYSVFIFLQGGGQSVQGAMLVYPRGGCGGTACRLFAHLLVCISQAGLELASGDTEVLLLLDVTWYGEALGVQGVEALIPFGAFFLPCVAPASQQNFWFTELILSDSAL